MIRFLQQQNTAQRVLLGTVIGVFVIILVVTLIPGSTIADWTSGGSNQAGVLATIGDQKVTVDEAQHQAQSVMRRNHLPDQFRAMVMPRIIDQLVLRAALINEADRMGLHVTDAELRDELRTGPLGQVLFPNGQFVGTDRYMDFIQGQFNLSVDAFEQQVKQDLLLQKLEAIVSGPAAVSEKEMVDYYDKQNEKVKFDYAYFSQPDLEKSINPTDAELRAYYDAHKSEYVNSIPEKRKIKYVVLDSSKIGAQVQVTQQDLQKYFDDHKSQYQTPARVKVAHILISPKPGKDGKPDDAAAKAKAEDILKQVKSGGNFADLAKKNSDDPGSAQNGGELGWISPKQTVPEFDQKAFSMKPGEISDLVHTSFGYHIIKVEDTQTAHQQSLDEVKSQIEDLVKAQKRSDAVNKYTDQFQSDVRSEGFDKAAQKFGLAVQTTDYITSSDAVAGIGQSPEFSQAVFGASKGNPVVARVPQGFAVVDVLDIKPPATPSFEEARQRVAQEFKSQQAQQLLQKKTQELADRAKADHDLKKAAGETGATFKSSDLVGNNDQVKEIGAMSGAAGAAFSLKQGDISGPLSSGTTGFVIEVVQTQLPTPAEFAKDKDQLRDQLLNQKRMQTFQLFAQSTRARLEKEGKIHLNATAQKQLEGSGAGQP